MPGPAAHEVTVLPHGRFFGRCDLRREGAGVTLSLLQPRVPEREVVRHTHADAHFVYEVAGAYLTTASGAPAISILAALGPGRE